MKVLLLLVALAGPAAAEEVWVLQSGPTPSDTVPLKPVQPVDAWRSLYTDGDRGVWVYVTRSPNFFSPASADVRRLAGTPWTAAVFFPESWPASRRGAWLDSWQSLFLSLSTFAHPGWPVVLPSVMRLGTLTKG